MREPGDIAAALPRPGRALKGVLGAIAACTLAAVIVVNWAPGGAQGMRLFDLVVFDPARAVTRPWTFLTSGLFASPVGISHALWSLVGLYFFSPDLEKRWGAGRFLRFLAYAVVLGNVAVWLASQLSLQHEIFHPAFASGPLAAITATVIAWSRERPTAQIRLMFFLPMSGRTLYLLTIGVSLLSLLFLQGAPEGAVAPLGGIASGILFGGSPSPMRSAWLRLKLALLRRRGARLTVESMLEDAPRPRTTAKRKGGASLRVVPGGLEDELKKRKPPKDKRYLN